MTQQETQRTWRPNSAPQELFLSYGGFEGGYGGAAGGGKSEALLVDALYGIDHPSYRAILSHEARGRPSIVMVNVTLKDQRQETMAAFEREILRCSEIVECFLMSGEADYMIQVEVRRDDSYERIHRETLARLPGVTRLASHFVIREVVRRS